MPEREESVRAFIAIELPPAVREEIARVQREARASGFNFVKWVEAGSIHLTLKFLGSVPAKQVADIVRALEQAAGRRTPFRLVVAGPGVFPGASAPRVAWLGLEGELDVLRDLQESVEENVAPLGYPTEKRRFAPHLTLARLREGASPAERRRFGEAFLALKSRPVAVWVEAVALMQSRLSPQGARYSRLAEVPLGHPSREASGGEGEAAAV